LGKLSELQIVIANFGLEPLENEKIFWKMFFFGKCSDITGKYNYRKIDGNNKSEMEVSHFSTEKSVYIS